MNEDILYKYVTGQADELERREVEDLSIKSEDFRKELNRLQNIWILSGVGNKIDDEFIQAEIEKILSKILVNKSHKRTRKLNFSLWQYAAAIVVSILVSGTIGYFISDRFSDGATAQTTKVVVARGEKSTVILPDGSEVKINSGSTLTFRNNFV